MNMTSLFVCVLMLLSASHVPGVHGRALKQDLLQQADTTSNIGDIFNAVAQTVGQGLEGLQPIADGALSIANQTAVGLVSALDPANVVPPTEQKDPVPAAIATAIQSLNAAAQSAAQAALDIQRSNGTDVGEAIRSAIVAVVDTANATIAAVAANNPNNASQALRDDLRDAAAAIEDRLGEARAALTNASANATGAPVAAGVLGALGGVFDQLAAMGGAATNGSAAALQPTPQPAPAAGAANSQPLLLTPSGTVVQAVDSGAPATLGGTEPTAIATTVAPPTSGAGAAVQAGAPLLLAGLVVLVQLLA